jgi:hypothetical protein
LRTVPLCPFASGTLLWQTQGGGYTLTVCVRGTFSLLQGREAALADAQEPVGGDRWFDDDPRASLYAPSDLVPFKPRADVVLVGSAYAPLGAPVEALVARVKLGALDKSIGIIGDRRWIETPDGPEPSAPTPFRSMPLRYERAARARDNPHGFDLTRPPTIGALALPNLEAADDEIGGGRTVGLGPITPFAPARRGMLRADAFAWAESGCRGPAPPSFDFAFYNAAPRDQQLDAVAPGQPLLLENLSREHARLETRLPTVWPKAFLVPNDGGQAVEIALRCDTVWINTDRALVTLSWRGLTAVATSDVDALGALVIAVEGQGREIGVAQIGKLLREGVGVSTDGDTLTEARPLGARLESVTDVDPDLLPTPGPFKPKRGLPSIESPTTGSAAIVPAPAPAPIVIEAEETASPVSWEEISQVEFIEPLADEKTLTRIEHGKGLMEQARGLEEELSTHPMLQHPERRNELGIEDLARIAVAAERGEAANMLFRYGLAMPDLPALERTWNERSASDPAFAQAFAAAVIVARRS